MSTGTNKQRITTNNGIISENNTDLANLKTRINALPTSGDTTATAEDIALGKTAVSKGVKLTGTMQPGIDTSDATATASDIVSDRTAYVNGQKITGSVVRYNSLNKNAGNAIDRGTTIEVIGNTGEVPLFLSSSSMLYMNCEQSKIANAINLQANNIKSGVSILGVTGTYEGLDTSDATVLSQDMAYGRTAYARGELITGTAMFVDTPNWTQLGYDTVPEALIADFNYSKNKLDNWNPQNIYDCANDTTLKYLPVLDLSLYDGYAGVFSGCTNLTTVSHLILNETVYIVDDMFANCPSLSNESLRNIITMLSAENMQHVYIKTLKKMGLSAEQAAICETFDEWALAVEQGWSTGYES